MKKIIVRALVGILAVFVILQFIPVDRPASAPMTLSPSIDPNVGSLFKRACFDCHSSATQWPWYSNVAPVSWLVIRDVEEGRKHLDFSKWDEVTDFKRGNWKEEIFEELEAEKMPPKMYEIMHSESKLTAEEKAILKKWAEAE